MSDDAYGVADRLLGPQSDEFYGLLGRIVAVSALLEMEMLDLRQGLGRLGQWECTKQPLTTLITESRKDLDRVSDPDVRQNAASFLGELSTWAERRNAYVHSIWPAQPGEGLFGWRPSRDATPGEPTTWVTLTLEEMRNDLLRLGHLHISWQRVWQEVQTAIALGRIAR